LAISGDLYILSKKEGVMSFAKNMSAEERKSHLRNLVSMSAKDGVLKEEEKSVLAYVAKKWNLSDAEISEVTKNPNSVKVSFPKDRLTSFHQLYDLTEMMIIDGEVRKAERELCTALAVNLGFKPEAVDTIIKGILNGNMSYSPEKEIQDKLIKLLV